MAFVLPSQVLVRIPNRRRVVSTRRQSPIAVAESTISSKRGFNVQEFVEKLYTGQRQMCSSLEAIDKKAAFSEDPWTSDNGSGGITRVLQHGAVFEKAGVNVSVVTGTLSEARAAAMRSRGRNCEPGMHYNAAALSFVCHAQSPFIPTLRGDVRIFAADGQVWAGGGADLTIFYVNRAQIARFHRHWKRVCDEFDESLYPQFKEQCDNYFYVSSRREHRGVGGIFYDDLSLPGPDLLSFQSRVLQEFLPSYISILSENIRIPWTEDQKRWQRIRRGRYLEFNLLEDRGVRFGLAGAPASRTDAIMISAPPSVEWPYGYKPDPGSLEEETIQLLEGTPLDWARVQNK